MTKYYLIDNWEVDIEDLHFSEKEKPEFDFVDSSTDLAYLQDIKTNIIYNESCDYVENELDFEPGTKQYDDNVSFEAEDHFSIVDEKGNILEL